MTAACQAPFRVPFRIIRCIRCQLRTSDTLDSPIALFQPANHNLLPLGAFAPWRALSSQYRSAEPSGSGEEGDPCHVTRIDLTPAEPAPDTHTTENRQSRSIAPITSFPCPQIPLPHLLVIHLSVSSPLSSCESWTSIVIAFRGKENFCESPALLQPTPGSVPHHSHTPTWRGGQKLS